MSFICWETDQDPVTKLVTLVRKCCCVVLGFVMCFKSMEPLPIRSYHRGGYVYHVGNLFLECMFTVREVSVRFPAEIQTKTL